MTGYWSADIAHRKDGKHQQPQNYFYRLMQQESFSFVILLFRFELVERTFEFGKSFRDDMEINCCGVYRLVAKKATDCIEVSSLVKEVGCEAVTKAMYAA